MTHLLKLFTLSAIVFALAAPLTAAPSYTGEVIVGSATGNPGEQIVVPVTLQNSNTDLMALSVPLRYNSAFLRVDSISFEGSLLKTNMAPLVQIDNAGQSLRFTYSPQSGLPLITEPSGLLASIYFTIDVSAAEQTVAIDSVNELLYSGPPDLWVRVEFADSSGLNLFLPQVSGGEVTILSPLDAEDGFAGLPRVLNLNQNYPNPFNPTTTIAFSLPERAHATLRVYNILGQEVVTLVDEVLSPGEHEIRWDASDRASGVYFYRLTFKDKAPTKKMALLK
jgi:hypothetical protein